MKKCIFCKTPIEHGNNALPLKDKECCDDCNLKLVIPSRLAIANGDNIWVRLREMEGEPQMKKGLEGRFKFVDGIGQIHVNWENGSSLALNMQVDDFAIIGR